MSRVLVTGATGFVGVPLCAALRERGHEVVEVARSRGVDLLELGAAERVIAEHAPTHLVHLAWYAEPGRYWTAVENLSWVEASLALLRAFAAHGGRRAVLAGTCAEYDWSYGFCSEAVSPLAPSTLYGVSKDALRRVAEAFASQAGLSLAWGRIFFLYGPREDPRRLVASVARALLAGEEAPTSEGSQVRDFLHVDDVAGAFAALLDAEAVTGAVNIGSGVPVSVRAVVEEVAAAAGRPELVRFGALAPRAGEPPLVLADARRLRDEVGWTPTLTLAEGIARTVDWWRG